MALTSTSVQERRRFVRSEPPAHFAINLLQPSLTAENVNVSEGGLCLRLRQMLEVRSLVQLQVTPGRTEPPRIRRSVKCTGRVTWVMQRLDLRNAPPFFFDTGIEFVNPPPALRQFMARMGLELAAVKRTNTRERILERSVIRGREYAPRLERTSARSTRWHLVVSIDGVPCFSEHYPSERAALAGWTKFKRQHGRR